MSTAVKVDINDTMLIVTELSSKWSLCQRKIEKGIIVVHSIAHTKYKYHISSKSCCGEILFQGPVWCSNNLRVVSTVIEKHTTLTISIAAHCMHGYCVCEYVYVIVIDPLPCSEILRATFTEMICLEVW